MNLIINFLNLTKLLEKKKIFLIVFLGPDGSGKSSLINKLMEEYKSYGSNHYSHFYPYFNKNISKTKIYPYSKRPYSTLLSSIKVIYMLLKNIYSLVFIILFKKKGETIIWCDRYLYDIFADPFRYRLNRIVFKPELIIKYTLKPNLIFILNPPIDDILKRSSEISRNELTKQHLSYEKLKNFFPESFFINSSSSINSLAQYCKFYINELIKE